MAVTVEVRGLAEARATIQALPGTTQAAASRMAYRAGAVVLRLWKLHLSGPGGARSLGVRSGALRNSVRMEKTGAAEVTVGTHLPYAAIHEFGGTTRPHVIRAKRANALRFVGSDGEVWYAKSVNHPGSKIPARPHREPAVRAAEQPMRSIFSGEMDRALREAAAAEARVDAAARARMG